MISSSVFATWQKVFSFRYGRAGSCGYFFNEFVGLVGSACDAGIWKTTDGGKTWIQGRLLTPDSTQAVNVTQIFMTDDLHGWATIEIQTGARSGILRTSDGGLTWTPSGPTGDYSCIYQTPSAVVAISRGNYGSGQISTDGGATFANTANMKYMNGIDFVDNTYGVASGFYDTTWKRTVDGGRTWTNITPLQRIESWSVYGMKGTSYFFACPEKDQRNPANVTPGPVIVSSDYGATWSVVRASLVGSIGTLTGASGVLYVQADTNRKLNPGVSGLFRSTDLGQTWVNVGGPSNGKDLRFVVTGCRGGVVYAFDAQGNVWKTRDGGDGAISEPPIDLQFDANSIDLSGPICSTTYATVRMLNPYCEDDSLVSVSLVDSVSALFSSGTLSVVSAPNLPLILRPNQQDSLVFKWEPFRLFHRDTTITTQIKLHYYSKILQRFLDTIVTLHAHAIGQLPEAAVQPASLDFKTVRFCQSYDSLFTFINQSCDTLRITGFTPQGAGGFQLLDSSGVPPTFPIVLAPGDSVSFDLRLYLDAAGAYANRLTFHLLHQGLTRDTTVAINAFMSSVGSYTHTDSLTLTPISTCAEIDTMLLVRNLGCKPLVITSAKLQSGAAFSLVGAPPYTSPIAPDSTGKVFLRFKPPATSKYDDVLTLSVIALGENGTITMPLHGSGFDEPAIFEASLPVDTLFDLSLTRCDSVRHYSIVISNPGCDSLTIISLLQSPPPGPNIVVSHDPLPAVLMAENAATVSVGVVITPKTVGIDSGVITIRYKLQGQPARDTTLRYFLRVGYGSRILATDVDSIDLGTMKFCDVKDTTIIIQSKGCDSLSLMSVNVVGQGDFELGQPSTLELAPNSQIPIRLHFVPTQAGTVTGTITITAHADPDSTKIIPIIAHVIPTDTLVFDLASSKVSVYAGDTVTFLMVPREDVQNKGLQSISFVLNYNGDLLTLLPILSGVLIPNAAFVADPPKGTFKHTTTHILLQGLPTLNFTAAQPAMKLVFVARLTDSVSSTMSISDVELNNDDQVYSKCELGVVAAQIDYSLALRCGDSTLIRFMQLGDASTLLVNSVIPNPISSETGLHARLPFVTHLVGDVRLEIVDELGRVVSTSSLHTDRSGSYAFDLDASEMPSGMYQFVMRHEGNGAAVLGRFSVIR